MLQYRQQNVVKNSGFEKKCKVHIRVLSTERGFKTSAHCKDKNCTLVNAYVNISTGTFTFFKEFWSYYEIVFFVCVVDGQQYFETLKKTKG